ncbi:MAG: hypothetical protein ACMXYK_00735 [Candidatus Woesearchaeota archaeon]
MKKEALLMIFLVLTIPFVTANDLTYGGESGTGQPGLDSNDGSNGGSSPGDDADSGNGDDDTPIPGPEPIPGPTPEPTPQPTPVPEDPGEISVPPVVRITRTFGQTVFGELPYTVVGGLIGVRFTATDPMGGAVTSQVTFTSGGASIPGQVSCQGNTCTAFSPAISEAGSYEIKVTATSSGGSRDVTANIRAVGELDIRVTGDVSQSPKGWDRSVSEKINQQMYAEITIRAGGLNIHEVSFDACISQENTGANSDVRGLEYVTVDFLGSSEDNTKHYLYLESKTASFDFNKIGLTCRFTVSAYSERGFINNEIAEIPVEITFYNNPAGMPEDAIVQKIENAVSQTEGVFKTLDSIYKWVQVLELICRIYNAYNAIVSLISSINNLLGISSTTIRNTGFGAPIAAAMDEAQRGLCGVDSVLTESAKQAFMGTDNPQTETGRTGNIVNGISSFCSWVACDRSLWEMLTDFGVENDFILAANETVNRINDPAMLNQHTTQGSWINTAFTEMSNANIGIFNSDNIVYLFMQMCIPGILRKAHEWRAIQCSYVLCLVEQVETGIYDNNLCENIRSSQECEYILKTFNFIPFLDLFDLVYDAIANLWATDVYGKIGMVTTMGCRMYCNAPAAAGTLRWGCDFWLKLQNLINSAAQINNIINTKGYFSTTPANDRACDDMNSALSKFREGQQAKENPQGGSVFSNNQNQYGGNHAGTSTGGSGQTQSGSQTTGSHTSGSQQPASGSPGPVGEYGGVAG